MAAKQDYYGTIGVARDAGADAIRKAYRRLARKFHPDLNPGDKAAEDRFKGLQEAYDVLSDPKKKQMYDQHGFYSATGVPEGGSPEQGGPNVGFGGFDFGDLFSGGGRAPGGEGSTGRFHDLFSQFFSGGERGQQRRPEKGADLEYALNIGFWQSIQGTQVRVNISRHVACQACGGSGALGGNTAACPECGGSGSVTQTAGAMRFNLSCPRCDGTGRLRNVCPTCRGEGRVATPETVEVRIPPGVQSGARLRVPGKGSAGTMGAPPGDLYITVRVDPHPLFVRDGDNIEVKIPVSVSEAGLGAKIEVPTVDGRAILKIPQGTRNGQRFRMREKGVLSSRSNTRGDQIVEVVLQAPKVADERTKELLRELAHIQSEDPRAELWNLAR